MYTLACRHCLALCLGGSGDKAGSAEAFRLSGPLLDRVDVKIELLPVGRKESLNGKGFAEPSHRSRPRR